jgi:RNA polymerase sigma-70 factor (ECF subfamily)
MAGTSGDPGSTASSLVAGVKALDPAAWRRLSALYGPLVYGWARRAGLRGEDAADITQEVFRAVLAGVGKLEHGRPADTFRGWLWAVTRNKLRDFWRRADGPVAPGGSDARDRLMLIADEARADDSDDPPAGDGLLGRAVESVRAEFEDRTWRAFWRVTVEGASAADVARELGMTANAVYVARHRVMRRLREILSDDQLGPSSG